MVGAISDSITVCLDTYNGLIERIRRIHALNRLGAEGLVLGTWEDELGRLRIWAADIGAHQTDQSSLDFRLRDASHIREQIVKLLQSLLRKIQDAWDVLTEYDGETPVASLVQTDDVVGGDDDDDVDNDDEDNDDDGPGRSEMGERRDDKAGTDPRERRSKKAFTYSNLSLAAQARQSSSLPVSEYGKGKADAMSSFTRRHKCPYCNTGFDRYHNLRSHLLTHGHEKPYQCDTCEARFRRLHDLKRHTKLHTGEIPHVCPKCGRTFARGDALARHNKGQGGCAGMRSSVEILGGEEWYDEKFRAGDGDSMPGIMYTDDNKELMDDLVDQEEPETEIQELQGSLATTINCLFEMSTLVRKPASHDIYIGSRHADVAAFEPSDYQYVKGRYPGADDALVTRLGNAITRRRKYLTLRKRRAIQLRQGSGNVYLGERDFADPQTIFDNDAWDKDISQFSTPSILPTANKFAVPPPPETSSAGAPIECPYCFYPVTSHGSRSWAEHVFQDLQPYICIAPICSSSDKLYSTRREWLHHSSMIHPPGTEMITNFVACPLCKEKLESGKQYDSHVARHLQDLALVLLPNSEGRSDVEDYQDSDSMSSAESMDLTTSDDRLKQL